MQGAEAARAFYTSPFTRRGALPRPVLGLIQDVGSVAVLDGAGHRVRKRMFLDMMAEGAVERLERTSDEEWTLAAVRWGRADHVVLLPAVEELLCRTACAWAGVPLGSPRPPTAPGSSPR